jgi:hypothetical protein
VFKGIDWLAVSNNNIPCRPLLSIIDDDYPISLLKRERCEKKISSKVTSFYTGGIFVKISVPMTSPVNYVRRTINTIPPPKKRDGIINPLIKNSNFHTGT